MILQRSMELIQPGMRTLGSGHLFAHQAPVGARPDELAGNAPSLEASEPRPDAPRCVVLIRAIKRFWCEMTLTAMGILAMATVWYLAARPEPFIEEASADSGIVVHATAQSVQPALNNGASSDDPNVAALRVIERLRSGQLAEGAAALVLARCGLDALPVLLQATADPSDLVRGVAVRALAVFGSTLGRSFGGSR